MSHPSSAAPRIALIVDNPYRDLPGVVLVAWRLCQSGATCYLVPMNLQGPELRPLAPTFVLLNYLRANNEALAHQMMEAGMRVGVLDTEGSVFSPRPATANAVGGGSTANEGETLPTLEEYALTMARDPEVRHRVACYCAWNPTFAEYASRAGWYCPEQIRVTGAPRADFYAPPWREVALCISPYADGYPGPVILINGGFPLANPGFQSPEQEVELLVSCFSYDRADVERWQRTEGEALRGLAAVANDLAQRFPEATVIYRPHPFEGEEVYQALLDPLPNLHVVKQGTVDGWLLRAKAMIHVSSSTAVDASLVGVPVFTPGWLPTHAPVPAVEAVSVHCATEEVLTEHVAAALNGGLTPPAEVRTGLQQVVEDTFYKIDGCAHRRVADAILRALDARGPRLSLGKCRDWAYGLGDPRLRWPARARAMVRKTLGLSVHWSFRHRREVFAETLPWDSSDKRFDAADVQRIVSAIAAAAPEPGRPVEVAPARAAGAYYFGYQMGRAVVMCPASQSGG